MKKFFAEFKEFINKGSVVDLAVGMIIGSAFTAIVNSVVNNIFNPLLRLIPGGKNGSALRVVLRDEVRNLAGEITQEAVIMDFSAVITAIVQFLLIALVLFLIVKAFNSARNAVEGKLKKHEEETK